ncbi:hypothetical protein SAMN05216490_1240 [Mucilaginibacter mallensis]|uniref:Uncharacterized protein n=1 Tax=Mucilaginibacter mallensis TaxID=652787 RepID=A0A1H1SKZ6_MUCMA|nr:hypothetical protein SAMN05216490_1240 [Mucilaginibacter mallensis]
MKTAMNGFMRDEPIFVRREMLIKTSLLPNAFSALSFYIYYSLFLN